MKNFFILAALIACIALTALYFIIPGNIVIDTRTSANVKYPSVLRVLQDSTKWKQWFPGKAAGATTFDYKGRQYAIGNLMYSAVEIGIICNKNQCQSRINIFPLTGDSSVIEWKVEMSSGNNPFTKIKTYLLARKTDNDIKAILSTLKNFIQSAKNIYGFDIRRTTLSDATLVSTKIVLPEYPSTGQVYALIDELKKYIQSQKAKEHNYPMLNVTKIKDSGYVVVVGIPTNIPLPANGNIQPKRLMMIRDKTLVTEVIGDTSMINKAWQAVSNYMQDYELSAPVISFEQLITDRKQQADSTKWVTRIFCPVI
ncbi:hypothetical protein [Parafilimonas sp.]|uniref:hypothetical protein n=1 Tax=Parafilimonas sp. TaxID=1969739 RepID=UPI0039E37C9B